MKKGDTVEDVTIETMAAEGKCVAKLNGQVLFIKGGAPGDTVDVELTRIKTSFLEGTVKTIKKFSADRAEPFCSHFGLCGGCSWQHINYETQLRYKQKQVVDNLERIGGLVLPEVNTILPSASNRYYRNRLDFTFSAERWMTRNEMERQVPKTPGLGYHLPRAYDRVFDVEHCYLQPAPSDAIRLCIRDTALREQIPFFDLRKQVGFLRTVTIRNTKSGEVMVILQVTYDKMEWIEKILGTLEKEFPEITSLQFVINGKRNDTFHDLDIRCWKGDPFITESMNRPDGSGPLKFRIGPKSFYQTNPDQAEVLYKTAWQVAKLKGTENVYDLYTGTGTIANYVSGQAARISGLEYVTEAIEDAKINSKINQIGNTEFFAGDIKELLNDEFASRQGKPDVIITDPPRAGMHEDVCNAMLRMRPQRIVYVSCNPATQARDLKIFSEAYTITSIQPVDMFPHTMHVENIVALERN